jgi:hypothetical protein
VSCKIDGLGCHLAKAILAALTVTQSKVVPKENVREVVNMNDVVHHLSLFETTQSGRVELLVAVM